MIFESQKNGLHWGFFDFPDISISNQTVTTFYNKKSFDPDWYKLAQYGNDFKGRRTQERV